MAFGLFSVPPWYPPPRPEGPVGWLQSDSLVLAIRWVCRFLSASPLSFLWVPCPPRSPSGQLEGHCGAWDSAGSREKAEGGTHWHLSLLTLHEFWYSRDLGRAYLAGVFLASSQMQSKKKNEIRKDPAAMRGSSPLHIGSCPFLDNLSITSKVITKVLGKNDTHCLNSDVAKIQYHSMLAY